MIGDSDSEACARCSWDTIHNTAVVVTTKVSHPLIVNDSLQTGDFQIEAGDQIKGRCFNRGHRRQPSAAKPLIVTLVASQSVPWNGLLWFQLSQAQLNSTTKESSRHNSTQCHPLTVYYSLHERHDG